MKFKKTLLSLFLLSVLASSWAEGKSADPGEKQAKAQTTPASSTNSDSALQTDLSKPIVVQPDSPLFKLGLNANAGTGYQWYLVDYNPRFIKLEEQKYVAPNAQVAGAPGLSVWQFQVQQIFFNAPQITHLRFEYRRAWESKVMKKEVITVISQQNK